MENKELVTVHVGRVKLIVILIDDESLASCENC